MATTKHLSLNNLILMIIVGVFLLHGSVESARRRRSGRSRRRSGDDDESSVPDYSGPVYEKGTWKSITADSTVYGLKDYKTRRLYKDSPDKEPAICFNAVAQEIDLNGKSYGYFVCPQKDDADDKAKCCGDSSWQVCCTGKLSPVAIGIIVGVCLLVGATIVAAVFIYRYRSIQRSKQRSKSNGE